MDYKKPGKARANKEFLDSLIARGYREPYKEESIALKKLFLIICEDKNTEPAYFKSFPVPSKTVEIIGGMNSKNALVNYAIKLKQSGKYNEHEIWCVYDFDKKPDEAKTQLNDFNSSITKAHENGMFVAWSNDAFELWFALHFDAIDVAITRNEINRKLKAKWGLESYKNEAKKEAFCEGHYHRHGGDKSQLQSNAIKRAKKLHAIYKYRNDYANQNPCTTVYLLVQELNKFLI
jgi:hypothetical protein